MFNFPCRYDIKSPHLWSIPNIYIHIPENVSQSSANLQSSFLYFLLLDLLIITTLKVLSYFIAIAVDVLGLII